MVYQDRWLDCSLAASPWYTMISLGPQGTIDKVERDEEVHGFGCLAYGHAGSARQELEASAIGVSYHNRYSASGPTIFDYSCTVRSPASR